MHASIFAQLSSHFYFIFVVVVGEGDVGGRSF